MDKNMAMAKLVSESGGVGEPSRECASKLVWGEGDLDCGLLIVGEAPGREEDCAGRPFVARGRRILDDELARAGISREDAYVTNVVKRRPIRERQGRLSNRPPTARERRAWRPTLLREIEIVRPSVVLCLGVASASAVIHSGFAMSQDRGKWFDGPSGSQAIATYHPAYLRRSPAALESFRGDLAAVRERPKGGEILKFGNVPRLLLGAMVVATTNCRL